MIRSDSEMHYDSEASTMSNSNLPGQHENELQQNLNIQNPAIKNLTRRQFTFKERSRKVISLIIFSIVSILSGALITETYLIFLTNRFSTEHLIYFLTLIPSYIFLRNMKTDQIVNQVLQDGTILTENIINPMKSIFAKIVMYSLFCVLIQMIIICFLNYLYSTLLVLICCIPILLVISFVRQRQRQRQQQQQQKRLRQRRKNKRVIQQRRRRQGQQQLQKQQQVGESDDSGSSDLEVLSVRSTQSDLEYLR